MTTIRERSTAALAEALGDVCADAMCMGARSHMTQVRDAIDYSPTVARRLDFATAWDESVAECKRLGWVFEGVYILSDRSDWGAYAYEPMTEDGTSHEAGQQTEEGHGPDETAALVALTAALRERAR